MEIKRVGVIGAGQMGKGIAHVFALAGFDVELHDVSEAALAAAPEIIRGNIDRQIHRGKVTAAERDTALARIHLRAELAALGETDLVIEAATEREPLKHQTSRRWCRTWRRTPSSPRIPRRSRSPGSPRAPTGPSGSWAFIS